MSVKGAGSHQPAHLTGPQPGRAPPQRETEALLRRGWTRVSPSRRDPRGCRACPRVGLAVQSWDGSDVESIGRAECFCSFFLPVVYSYPQQRYSGDLLAAQQLGLCASTAGATGVQSLVRN